MSFFGRYVSSIVKYWETEDKDNNPAQEEDIVDNEEVQGEPEVLELSDPSASESESDSDEIVNEAFDVNIIDNYAFNDDVDDDEDDDEELNFVENPLYKYPLTPSDIIENSFRIPTPPPRPEPIKMITYPQHNPCIPPPSLTTPPPLPPFPLPPIKIEGLTLPMCYELEMKNTEVDSDSTPTPHPSEEDENVEDVSEEDIIELDTFEDVVDGREFKVEGSQLWLWDEESEKWIDAATLYLQNEQGEWVEATLTDEEWNEYYDEFQPVSSTRVIEETIVIEEDENLSAHEGYAILQEEDDDEPGASVQDSEDSFASEDAMSELDRLIEELRQPLPLRSREESPRDVYDEIEMLLQELEEDLNEDRPNREEYELLIDIDDEMCKPLLEDYRNNEEVDSESSTTEGVSDSSTTEVTNIISDDTTESIDTSDWDSSTVEDEEDEQDQLVKDLYEKWVIRKYLKLHQKFGVQEDYCIDDLYEKYQEHSEQISNLKNFFYHYQYTRRIKLEIEETYEGLLVELLEREINENGVAYCDANDILYWVDEYSDGEIEKEEIKTLREFVTEICREVDREILVERLYERIRDSSNIWRIPLIEYVGEELQTATVNHLEPQSLIVTQPVIPEDLVCGEIKDIPVEEDESESSSLSSSSDWSSYDDTTDDSTEEFEADEHLTKEKIDQALTDLYSQIVIDTVDQKFRQLNDELKIYQKHRIGKLE